MDAPTRLPAGSVLAVLPAAGQSRRFGSEEKKIFAPLRGVAVWEHAVGRLRARREVGAILLAVAADDWPRWRGDQAAAVERWEVQLVEGGAERVDSVRAALEHSGDRFGWVAVHDAARPLVPDDDLSAVFAAAAVSQAALLATPVRGTLKRQRSGAEPAAPEVAQTLDRRGVWEAQTPQVFAIELLRDAYRRWRGWPVTDDAQLVERAGYSVRLVPGSSRNIKLTTADDLALAEALLDAPS